MALNLKNKIKKTEVTADGITAATVAAGADAGAAAGHPELLKLKKRELLEIMLKQGEEIDSLNARIEELQKQLADKQAELERHEFEIQKFGSIAEASLQVTDIFKEAEKAAKIYLENLRRRYG